MVVVLLDGILWLGLTVLAEKAAEGAASSAGSAPKKGKGKATPKRSGPGIRSFFARPSPPVRVGTTLVLQPRHFSLPSRPYLPHLSIHCVWVRQIHVLRW